MTDEELVKRLRAVEIDDDHDLWENSHLLAEAAATIERLTRERDEALRRRIVYSPDAKALSDRADAAVKAQGLEQQFRKAFLEGYLKGKLDIAAAICTLKEKQG